jgi:hypothetical protein
VDRGRDKRDEKERKMERERERGVLNEIIKHHNE